MTTVAFATNYPMTDVRERVARGELPGQHLWGADALADAGYRVQYVESPSRGALGGLSRMARLALGDFGAELRARGDIAYAADHHTFRGLGLLRQLGVGRPLVQVVHHVPTDRLFPRAAVVGPDICVTLTATVADALVARGRPRDRTKVLAWGPDLSFPGYQSKSEDFILACGKANRDNRTLLTALASVSFPSRVYRYDDQGTAGTEHVDEVSLGPARSEPLHLHYAQILSDLRRAAVIAIPLADPKRLSGLSELNDALALGKPVVMTRSPMIDVDIEAEGCGIWVAEGDVAGWVDALRTLAADPTRRAAMGSAGRAFAERSWNAEIFGQGVIEAVRQAESSRGGRP